MLDTLGIERDAQHIERHRDVSRVSKRQIRAAQSPHAGRRAAAARALGAAADATAVELLTALLDDEDAGVVVSAQAALAEIGEPAVGPLLGLLESDGDRRSLGAAGALSGIGTATFRPLRQLLHAEGWRVRRAAARALGGSTALGTTGLFGFDKALRTAAVRRNEAELAARLVDESSPVRAEAAAALGAIADPRSLDDLRAALQRERGPARHAAAEAILRVEDKKACDALVTCLGIADPDLQLATASALADYFSALGAQLPDPGAAPDTVASVALRAALRRHESSPDEDKPWGRPKPEVILGARMLRMNAETPGVLVAALGTPDAKLREILTSRMESCIWWANTHPPVWLADNFVMFGATLDMSRARRLTDALVPLAQHRDPDVRAAGVMALEGLAGILERQRTVTRRILGAGVGVRQWTFNKQQAAPILAVEKTLADGAAAGRRVEPRAGLTERSPVERYVDLRYPARVTPNAVFDIAIAIKRDPVNLPDDARPIDIAPTTDESGRPTGAPPLVVQIRHSEAFDLLSEVEATIEVPIDRSPPPAAFTLRAADGVRGIHEVNIVFFQGPEVLGQVPLVITIAARAADRPEAAADQREAVATFRRAPRARDLLPVRSPSAILTVNRTSYRGRDTLSYAFEWCAQRWPRIDAGTVELQTGTTEWARRQYQRLSGYARQSAADAEGQASELARIGENLYRELVPPELRDVLAKFLPDGDSLLIYTSEPWIPWEIVKPWGDDISPDESDFLCSQLALGRWYYSAEGQSAPGAIPAHRLGTVASGRGLPAVAQEVDFLTSIPVVWPPIELVAPSPSTKQQVLRALGAGDVNLMHFATHGIPQSDGGDVAMLRLGRTELSVDDLVGTEVARGLRRGAPLVFMNACHSARRDPGLTRTDGWAERFLEFGSSAFVGANWEVLDSLAFQFARAFYNAIREGTTIGAAVKAARQLVRDAAPGNSTWLAYTLYGHPNAIVRAVSKEGSGAGRIGPARRNPGQSR